jgi:hypothetical protein
MMRWVPWLLGTATATATARGRLLRLRGDNFRSVVDGTIRAGSFCKIQASMCRSIGLGDGSKPFPHESGKRALMFRVTRSEPERGVTRQKQRASRDLMGNGKWEMGNGIWEMPLTSDGHRYISIEIY